jgi:DNA-binding transcriptional MerR regulator
MAESSGGLPPKLYFRIGEVAELVGVEPHVLRYWEREFRSIRPTKSAKGQRVYSRRDVEGLLRVRELLYKEGFTIAGARKKLQRSGVEPAQSTDSSAPGAGKTREQLLALRDEIEAFLAELDPRRSDDL